jgi:uncharacterized protein (TIGR00255 family)
MIKSMTGYGRAEAVLQGRSIAVEIKSVNHRFLEISLRLPSALFPLELELKKKIGGKLQRGRVEVFIKLDADNSETSNINLNMDVARNYLAALTKLKEGLGLKDDISLKMLLGFRDIFSPPAELQLGDDILKKIEELLAEALTMLLKMRAEEGQAIYQDMAKRIEDIEKIMGIVNARAPQVVLEYQKRLAERIKELTDGYALDDSRLHQEVALMADKADITEEIVRMHSHSSQFVSLLKSDEAEGKKIDFLLQEMNREINTIGSKSNDADIARQVIEAKSELSKLREQAQNIE